MTNSVHGHVRTLETMICSVVHGIRHRLLILNILRGKWHAN